MSRERCTEGALFAAATLGSGALALALGQDVNFDQVSYHIYLGWSLVAGRLGLDIAPAGVGGSYINPLVQAVHFLGLTRLPLRVFGFVLGATHGLNLFLVYRLARHVLRGIEHERALSTLAGVMAAAGPCAVGLLGTTFGDNLLSIPVLAAFLLLLQVADEPHRAGVWRLVLVGVLGGAATGLKLTFATSLLALLASVFFLAFRSRNGWAPVAFGAGSVLGVPLTAGYWGFQMWQRFGNPIFPFANNVFRSPYLPPVALRDPRWAPQEWADLVTAPVQMALGLTDRLQEVAFRDLRYLILFVIATAVLARSLSRKSPPGVVPASAPVVVVGWMAGYGAWAIVFHYYRYFAAGELLAPVAILALLRMLDARRLPFAWLAVAVVVVVTATTGSWGRADWTDGPLHVRVPLAPAKAPAVVMVDGFGISFVLPFFPPGTRFFAAYGGDDAFGRLVTRELERHQGPVLRLRPPRAAPTPLERLGLVDDGRCTTFRTGGRGRVSLCPLTRVSPGR